MTDLRIELTKRSDGSVVLKCVRADGSATWQRQTGQYAQFFPVHDLRHCAVEPTLRHRRGFYGLIAEGWDVTDFGAPWPKGKIPADAEPAELIVGFLDAERAGGIDWTVEQFDEHASQYFAEHGLKSPPVLGDEQLNRIRQTARELFTRWLALPAGQTLELPFDRTFTNS